MHKPHVAQKQSERNAECVSISVKYLAEFPKDETDISRRKRIIKSYDRNRKTLRPSINAFIDQLQRESQPSKHKTTSIENKEKID